MKFQKYTDLVFLTLSALKSLLWSVYLMLYCVGKRFKENQQQTNIIFPLSILLCLFYMELLTYFFPKMV